MLVEVVLREVGEADRREPGAVHALVGERVRAHLHRDGVDGRAVHPGQQLLELGRLGGRELERLLDPVDPGTGGPDDPDRLAGGACDGLEQVGRRGLAVRPGHPEHAHRVGRVAVEASRERPERPAHLRHPRLGDRDLERAVDEQRHRAALHRRGRVVVAVGDRAANAAEQGTSGRAATVVHDVGDVDLRVPGQLEQVDGVEEVVQAHGILSVNERAGKRYRPRPPRLEPDRPPRARIPSFSRTIHPDLPGPGSTPRRSWWSSAGRARAAGRTA